ncbi:MULTISPECIES: hypothetical protein [Amycolatopsis]|uniref:hypothetical protein n=1 Tax=Amycolatopsis TaxID=1813 RepID=UPI00174B1FF9|nr:hypothetical protein [Amycolatopsis bullii]
MLIPVVVLVVLQLGWLSWLVADGGPVRKVLEALSWIAAILGVGFSFVELRKQRPNPAVERSVYMGRALHLDGDRLPKVADVSLLALRVKRAVDTLDAEGRDLPPYVPRDRDEDLEWAIATGGLVLLHGRAAAGKSRAAAEAVRRLRPHHDLLVPVDGPALRRIAESSVALTDTVVWLDDLERFLVPDGFDVGLLQQLAAPDSSVCVVATIRDNELAAYRTADGAINQAAADLISAIPPSHLIVIKQHLTTTEQEGARTAQASDPRVRRALAAPEGFAEYLAAGTSMLERWSIGDSPLFYLGQALISAAVDCRRAGYTDAVTSTALAELYRDYLPSPWGDRPDLPPIADGLAWAARPVLGASSCLQPRTDGTFLASDYLVDRAQEGTSPLGDAPIPDGTWEVLFRLSADQSVVSLGFGAYRAGRFEVAERCFRRAFEAGDQTALGLVAIAIGSMGRFSEVRAIFENAARSGNKAVTLRAALSLSLNGRFEDMLDLAHQAADIGDGYALLALANCFAPGKRWGDLFDLAVYTVDHDLKEMVTLVMTTASRHLSENDLLRLACHALDSHYGDAIVSTLLSTDLSPAQTSALLQHALRSTNTEGIDAVLAWLAHRQRFAEVTAFAGTMLHAGENGILRSAMAALIEHGRIGEFVTLSKESIDVSNTDAIHASAAYLNLKNRQDIFDELIQHAAGIGNVESLEILENSVGGRHDSTRTASHDDADEGA